MAGSISKVNLLLGANGTEMNKGLDDSKNRIKKWADETDTVIKNLKTDMQRSIDTKGMTELQKKIFDLKKAGADPGQIKQLEALQHKADGGALGSLTRGLSSGPVVAIGAAVAAVAAAAYGLKTIFDGVAEAVGRSAAQARNLNTGIEGLTALQYAARIAGVSTEDLSGAMMTLQRNLAMSDGAAGHLFGQLGLSVAQLRAMPIDEATATITDALDGIANPTERARLALATMGDTVVGLRPLLDRGGAGIRSLTQAARDSGIAVNEIQAQRLNEAREAVARLGANWEGMKTQIAQAIGPVLEWGAAALQSFTAPEGALQQFNASVQENITVPVLRMSASVVDVFSNLGTEISDATSGWGETISGWASSATSTMQSWGQAVADEVMPMITAAIEAIQPALDALGEAWDSVWSAITETLNEVSDLIENGISYALESLGIDAKEAFEEINSWIEWIKEQFMALWNAISGFWNRIFGRSAAGDAIRDIADTVEEAVNTVRGAGERAGRGIGEAVARGARDALNGISAEMLQGITKLRDELIDSISKVGLTGAQAKIFDLRKSGATDDQLEELEALAEKVKNVEIAFGNIKMPPLETFNRAVEGLDTLLEQGRITQEQYAQGLMTASENLQNAVGGLDVKSPSGLVKDSKEAVSAIINSRNQDQKNDPQEQLRRAILQGQELQRRQATAAERLVALVEEGDIDLGVI